MCGRLSGAVPRAPGSVRELLGEVAGAAESGPRPERGACVDRDAQQQVRGPACREGAVALHTGQRAREVLGCALNA